MDQERDDYAELEPPARRMPLWVMEVLEWGPPILVAVVSCVTVVLFIDTLVNGC
jgi:hypothetical protein